MLLTMFEHFNRFNRYVWFTPYSVHEEVKDLYVSTVNSTQTLAQNNLLVYTVSTPY